MLMLLLVLMLVVMLVLNLMIASLARLDIIGMDKLLHVCHKKPVWYAQNLLVKSEVITLQVENVLLAI